MALFGGHLASIELRRARKDWAQLSRIEIVRRTKGHYLTGGALNRRSSDLVNSIFDRNLPDDYGFVVGTDVVYGIAWELGRVPDRRGGFRDPRKFLEPSFRDNEDFMVREAERLSGRAVEAVFTGRTIRVI